MQMEDFYTDDKKRWRRGGQRCWARWSLIGSYSSYPASSASSSSSACSGTRFLPAARSDLRVPLPPAADPWSGTCCTGTPSPAPGSGVWCKDTFSSGWTLRGSNSLMDSLQWLGGEKTDSAKLQKTKIRKTFYEPATFGSLERETRFNHSSVN